MCPQIYNHVFSLCTIWVCYAMSQYSPVLTHVILSHTPKYGNQQRTSQDAKMLCSILSLLSEAQEGRRQFSPLNQLLTTMCDTVLQVHCGLPVMLFYSPGQKGASACIAACFPLNKTGWISKQNVKQKTAWPSQCLPAFSGEWRHGLASKCILISCWYWWANWWESRSCLT